MLSYIISFLKFAFIVSICVIIYWTSNTTKDMITGYGYFIFAFIIYMICSSTLVSAADAPDPFEPRGHTDDQLSPEEYAKYKSREMQRKGTDAVSRFFSQAFYWANAKDSITGDFSWVEEDYKNYIKPKYALPPGYTNLNYKFNIDKKNKSQYDTEFCRDHPTCYPCPGWTEIGTPSCVG